MRSAACGLLLAVLPWQVCRAGEVPDPVFWASEAAFVEQVSEGDEHVRAGKLRILATSRPLAEYSGVPTFESLGMKFRLLKRFRGVMAPPAIPPEAVNFYIQTLEKTRGTAEWKDYVRKFAVTEDWLVGKDLAAFLQEEENTYRKLMVQLGLMKK